jgi:hypothetical protein
MRVDQLERLNELLVEVEERPRIPSEPGPLTLVKGQGRGSKKPRAKLKSVGGES